MKHALMSCASLMLLGSFPYAWAQTASSSGAIVFVSNRDEKKNDDNRELYVTDLKSNEKRLTNHPLFDGMPSISPDGKSIAFYSTRDGSGEVYVMNKSGTNLKRITNTSGGGVSSYPSWGGQEIVVSSNPNGEFQIYRLNTKTLSKTLALKQFGSSAALSPNGRWIAFVSAQQSDRESSIYVANVDGSKVRRLIYGDNPSFNSRSDTIVFNYRGLLYKINIDGKELKRLSLRGSLDSQPCFSPNDQHVAFSSSSSWRSARGMAFSGSLPPGGKHDIYVMRADGTQVRRVTFGPGNNIDPSWGIIPGVPYVSPPASSPAPTPIALTASPVSSEPMPFRSETFAGGELVSAFNDLLSAPYPSFLMDSKEKTSRSFRVQGLEGTEGDFVFDPQFLPDGQNVVVKLGDPQARPENPYNSYRLWNWNRATNTFTPFSPRALFFPTIAPSPDGQHLAYIAGGNALGHTPEENGGIGEALRLYVYNPRTKKETLVSSNSGVRGGFAWLDKDTLLFNVLPTGSPNSQTGVRPEIHTFDVKSGEKRLLIRDASHPTPSPDGTRIAFYGLRLDTDRIYPLSADWWQRPGPASLSVVARDGTGRKSFGSRPGRYPSLMWTTDSGRLLMVRPERPFPQAQTKAVIEEWNLAQGGSRVVGTLQAKDSEPIDRWWFRPQFRLLPISAKGETLLVAVEEAVKEETTPRQARTVTRIEAVDLKLGTSSLVARLKDQAGFDWRDAGSSGSIKEKLQN